MGYQQIASVNKALSLLSHFTPERPVLTLEELCMLAGFSRSTAYRLVVTLEKAGFLQRLSDHGKEHRYRLGFKFLELGSMVREQLEVRRVALTHMIELRNRVGDSVQLVVVDGPEGVYVEVVEAIKPVRLYIRPGRRAPLYAGASTRLLLAFMPQQRIAEILKARPPRPHTPATVTDVPKLMEILSRVREDGYALSRAELEPGSAELAVPLRDYTKKVVAALSIAGPLHAYQDEDVKRLLPVLKQAAWEISRGLGYPCNGEVVEEI